MGISTSPQDERLLNRRSASFLELGRIEVPDFWFHDFYLCMSLVGRLSQIVFISFLFLKDCPKIDYPKYIRYYHNSKVCLRQSQGLIATMDFYIFQNLNVNQNETRFYSCTQRTCKCGQVDTETLIKASGIPFTILRNNKYIRLLTQTVGLPGIIAVLVILLKSFGGISILLGYATRIILLSYIYV